MKKTMVSMLLSLLLVTTSYAQEDQGRNEEVARAAAISMMERCIQCAVLFSMYAEAFSYDPKNEELETSAETTSNQFVILLTELSTYAKVDEKELVSITIKISDDMSNELSKDLTNEGVIRKGYLNDCMHLRNNFEDEIQKEIEKADMSLN